MKQTLSAGRPFPVFAAAFFFFLGIAVGTLWGNGPGKETAGAFLSGNLPAGGGLQEISRDAAGLPDLFFRRAAAAGILWLIGLSSLAVPGAALACGLLGFSAAFLISLMTLRAGTAGIVLFAASMFPQCLFYLPVFWILLAWAFSGRKKTHGAAFLILLFLTALGAAAELFLCPRIVYFARGFF